MRGNVANSLKVSGLVPVSHAGFGEQVTGPGRVIFQLAAQPCHVEAEIVSALLEAGPPYPGQDLRRPDELARPVQQDGQDAPFSGREPQRHPLTVPTGAARTVFTGAARTVPTGAARTVTVRGRPPDLVRG